MAGAGAGGPAPAPRRETLTHPRPTFAGMDQAAIEAGLAEVCAQLNAAHGRLVELVGGRARLPLLGGGGHPHLRAVGGVAHGVLTAPRP